MHPEAREIAREIARGRLVGHEGASDAGALVVAADAVDDSQRGHLREYRRLRQLMEKLYRVAKSKYNEDGDYEKFKKVEETYYSTVTKLDMKFGMF